MCFTIRCAVNLLTRLPCVNRFRVYSSSILSVIFVLSINFIEHMPLLRREITMTAAPSANGINELTLPRCQDTLLHQVIHFCEIVGLRFCTLWTATLLLAGRRRRFEHAIPQHAMRFQDRIRFAHRRECFAVVVRRGEVQNLYEQFDVHPPVCARY